MTPRKTICCWTTALALGLALPGGPPAQATTLSVNFGMVLNDANAVDSDEFAVFAPAGEARWGDGWNNILIQSSGSIGPPVAFQSATQFGNFITLNDETGAPTAAQMTSTGTMYCDFLNASSPNQATTGEGGLMQSYLAIGDLTADSVTISGLNAALGSSRYELIIYAENKHDRPAGEFTITDGIRTFTVWKTDVAATDCDADDDGFIEWVQATGTSDATATVDANYIRVTGLSGDSVTITGDSTTNQRMAINGLQIIELPDSPCPADLNADGLVSTADFVALLSAWGDCP